ncbi:RpiB/LacA/LacB family sugar-phosphate isomerase [Candidatus Roizmanbacteria bacterium]|nr:RpiB/LacA/LacB family sugar-phosphate isomerase [Candidatus Roizmanbacteria bacterium]
MTIFIGADHRGFELKNAILEYLHEKNIRIEDLGPYELAPLDDAIDYSQKVAQAVLQNPENYLGIVICGSGCAVAMAANRFKGIRSGVAMNPSQSAHLRENDHVNILALASDYTPTEEAHKVVDAFLSAAPKMDEKYLRRVEKLDKA